MTQERKGREVRTLLLLVLQQTISQQRKTEKRTMKPA